MGQFFGGSCFRGAVFSGFFSRGYFSGHPNIWCFVFSYELCEIFKNSFFYETPMMTVSVAEQSKMVATWKPLQIIFYLIDKNNT